MAATLLRWSPILFFPLCLPAPAQPSNNATPSCSSVATTTPECVTPTATIDAGVILGTTTLLPSATAHVNKFLGVPFAKSPPTRFAPPESPGTFSKPINATAWSPACIQQFVYPKKEQEFVEQVFSKPMPKESEDCLYLNVYAPTTPPPPGGRAVMFWIFGGSLQFGTAGQPMYDGSGFASYEDVIIVSTNYRTNLFGFPPSSNLPLTGHNLGFWDQRFALDWVQRNIAAFGGSPDKVTIFGESAGGVSVDALLTSFGPNTKPPFRGAIAESGVLLLEKFLEPKDAMADWDKLAAALGCPGSHSSNFTCIQHADAYTIRSIIDKQILKFGPIPDNVTLVSDATQRRLKGDIAQVPVMGGTNAQEGRAFTVGLTNTTEFLEGTLGLNSAEAAAIEAAYLLNSPGIENSAYDQLAQIYTEVVFQCPQALWANDSASVGIPSWLYYFNASFVNTQLYPELGVYHSSEIPLVFGTYPVANATTQEVALSASMMGAWARFAKNPKAGPGWNEVSTGASGTVLTGATGKVVGGVYASSGGKVEPGAFSLGVFGNRLDAMGSGVTVINPYEVNHRCELFVPLYNKFNS